MSNPDLPTATAMWRSVEQTALEVLLPALPPGHERDTAVQLAGLARYARERAGHDLTGLVEDIARALPGEPDGYVATMRQAADLLVDAVERTGRIGGDPTADEVRRLLLEMLDRQAESVAPLLETFSGHPATDVEPVEREIDSAERDGLTGWLADVLGAPARLTRAVVMPGGHSRRMLRVQSTTDDGAEHDLVIRIEQGGMFATAGTPEARAMEALAGADVPLPKIVGIEPTGTVLGQPFFAMAFEPGRNEVDERLLTGFVRELDRIHGLDPAIAAGALGPPPATPAEAVTAGIDHWMQVYRSAVEAPVPLLEEAAAWLRRNLRPTGPVALVHGDPGPGNALGVDGRLTSILDWEFVHYGDPAEDWAYLTAIRGRKLMDRAAWRRFVGEAAGVSLADVDWDSWEIYNQFKGACVNLTALRVFAEGTATTPNLPTIGTAIHLRFLRACSQLLSTLSSTSEHA